MLLLMLSFQFHCQSFTLQKRGSRGFKSDNRQSFAMEKINSVFFTRQMTKKLREAKYSLNSLERIYQTRVSLGNENSSLLLIPPYSGQNIFFSINDMINQFNNSQKKSIPFITHVSNFSSNTDPIRDLLQSDTTMIIVKDNQSNYEQTIPVYDFADGYIETDAMSEPIDVFPFEEEDEDAVTLFFTLASIYLSPYVFFKHLYTIERGLVPYYCNIEEANARRQVRQIFLIISDFLIREEKAGIGLLNISLWVIFRNLWLISVYPNSFFWSQLNIYKTWKRAIKSPDIYHSLSNTYCLPMLSLDIKQGLLSIGLLRYLNKQFVFVLSDFIIHSTIPQIVLLFGITTATRIYHIVMIIVHYIFKHLMDSMVIPILRALLFLFYQNKFVNFFMRPLGEFVIRLISLYNLMKVNVSAIPASKGSLPNVFLAIYICCLPLFVFQICQYSASHKSDYGVILNPSNVFLGHNCNRTGSIRNSMPIRDDFLSTITISELRSNLNQNQCENQIEIFDANIQNTFVLSAIYKYYYYLDQNSVEHKNTKISKFQVQKIGTLKGKALSHYIKLNAYNACNSRKTLINNHVCYLKTKLKKLGSEPTLDNLNLKNCIYHWLTMIYMSDLYDKREVDPPVDFIFIYDIAKLVLNIYAKYKKEMSLLASENIQAALKVAGNLIFRKKFWKRNFIKSFACQCYFYVNSNSHFFLKKNKNYLQKYLYSSNYPYFKYRKQKFQFRIKNFDKKYKKENLKQTRHRTISVCRKKENKKNSIRSSFRPAELFAIRFIALAFRSKNSLSITKKTFNFLQAPQWGDNLELIYPKLDFLLRNWATLLHYKDCIYSVTVLPISKYYLKFLEADDNTFNIIYRIILRFYLKIKKWCLEDKQQRLFWPIVGRFWFGSPNWAQFLYTCVYILITSLGKISLDMGRQILQYRYILYRKIYFSLIEIYYQYDIRMSPIKKTWYQIKQQIRTGFKLKIIQNILHILRSRYIPLQKSFKLIQRNFRLYLFIREFFRWKIKTFDKCKMERWRFEVLRPINKRSFHKTSHVIPSFRNNLFFPVKKQWNFFYRLRVLKTRQRIIEDYLRLTNQVLLMCLKIENNALNLSLRIKRRSYYFRTRKLIVRFINLIRDLVYKHKEDIETNLLQFYNYVLYRTSQESQLYLNKAKRKLHPFVKACYKFRFQLTNVKHHPLIEHILSEYQYLDQVYEIALHERRLDPSLYYPIYLEYNKIQREFPLKYRYLKLCYQQYKKLYGSEVKVKTVSQPLHMLNPLYKDKLELQEDLDKQGNKNFDHFDLFWNKFKLIFFYWNLSPLVFYAQDYLNIKPQTIGRITPMSIHKNDVISDISYINSTYDESLYKLVDKQKLLSSIPIYNSKTNKFDSLMSEIIKNDKNNYFKNLLLDEINQLYIKYTDSDSKSNLTENAFDIRERSNFLDNSILNESLSQNSSCIASVKKTSNSILDVLALEKELYTTLYQLSDNHENLKYKNAQILISKEKLNKFLPQADNNNLLDDISELQYMSDNIIEVDQALIEKFKIFLVKAIKRCHISDIHQMYYELLSILKLDVPTKSVRFCLVFLRNELYQFYKKFQLIYVSCILNCQFLLTTKDISSLSSEDSFKVNLFQKTFQLLTIIWSITRNSWSIIKDKVRLQELLYSHRTLNRNMAKLPSFSDHFVPFLNIHGDNYLTCIAIGIMFFVMTIYLLKIVIQLISLNCLIGHLINRYCDTSHWGLRKLLIREKALNVYLGIELRKRNYSYPRISRKLLRLDSLKRAFRNFYLKIYDFYVTVYIRSFRNLLVSPFVRDLEPVKKTMAHKYIYSAQELFEYPLILDQIVGYPKFKNNEILQEKGKKEIYAEILHFYNPLYMAYKSNFNLGLISRFFYNKLLFVSSYNKVAYDNYNNVYRGHSFVMQRKKTDRNLLIEFNIDNLVTQDSLISSRGYMLVGKANSGRHYFAKSFAAQTHLPLVTLDFSNMLIHAADDIVSETTIYSKTNMKPLVWSIPEFATMKRGKSVAILGQFVFLLKLAKKIAPCVVWIPKLELFTIQPLYKKQNALVGGPIRAAILSMMRQNYYSCAKPKMVFITTVENTRFLDPIWFSPDRFSKIINVQIPTVENREERILSLLHIRGMTLTSDFDFTMCRNMTMGFGMMEISSFVDQLYILCCSMSTFSVNTYLMIEAMQGLDQLLLPSQEQDPNAFTRTSHYKAYILGKALIRNKSHFFPQPLFYSPDILWGTSFVSYLSHFFLEGHPGNATITYLLMIPYFVNALAGLAAKDAYCTFMGIENLEDLDLVFDDIITAGHLFTAYYSELGSKVANQTRLNRFSQSNKSFKINLEISTGQVLNIIGQLDLRKAHRQNYFNGRIRNSAPISKTRFWTLDYTGIENCLTISYSTSPYQYRAPMYPSFMGDVDRHISLRFSMYSVLRYTIYPLISVSYYKRLFLKEYFNVRRREKGMERWKEVYIEHPEKILRDRKIEFKLLTTRRAKKMEWTNVEGTEEKEPREYKGSSPRLIGKQRHFVLTNPKPIHPINLEFYDRGLLNNRFDMSVVFDAYFAQPYSYFHQYKNKPSWYLDEEKEEKRKQMEMEIARKTGFLDEKEGSIEAERLEDIEEHMRYQEESKKFQFFQNAKYFRLNSNLLRSRSYCFTEDAYDSYSYKYSYVQMLDDILPRESIERHNVLFMDEYYIQEKRARMEKFMNIHMVETYTYLYQWFIRNSCTFKQLLTILETRGVLWPEQLQVFGRKNALERLNQFELPILPYNLYQENNFHYSAKEWFLYHLDLFSGSNVTEISIGTSEKSKKENALSFEELITSWPELGLDRILSSDFSLEESKFVLEFDNYDQ